VVALFNAVETAVNSCFCSGLITASTGVTEMPMTAKTLKNLVIADKFREIMSVLSSIALARLMGRTSIIKQHAV
jgi:hypothetical protein